MGYVEEPDGTRVYDNAGRTRYKPKTGKKYRKCPPGYVLYRGEFYGPLPVLPDKKRVMPRTVSEKDVRHHPVVCRCQGCWKNPYAVREKQLRLFGRIVTPGLPVPEDRRRRRASPPAAEVSG